VVGWQIGINVGTESCVYQNETRTRDRRVSSHQEKNKYPDWSKHERTFVNKIYMKGECSAGGGGVKENQYRKKKASAQTKKKLGLAWGEKLVDRLSKDKDFMFGDAALRKREHTPILEKKKKKKKSGKE